MMKEWEEFLQSLERELGADAVQKWMPKCVRFDARNIYLEAKDSFQIEWFEEHVRGNLKGLVNQNGTPIKVHLAKEEKKGRERADTGPQFSIHQDPLDPEMTLDHFITSEENLVCHQIVQEECPFNPIYLYGPKGAGKTHLLMGAANALRARGKRVFFVRASTFADHVVQAIRLGQMQEFRKIYRDIDALVVDDIHIFSKKSATQEEFFHTFNTLHTSGRPIILSANVSPMQLNAVEPRLISRFEWGISLELIPSPLDPILEKKSALWNYPLTKELKSWLIQSFGTSSIMALQALILRSDSVVANPLVAEKLLKDLLEKEREKAITHEKIIKIIAAHYGITSEDILGKSQMKTVALPRQIAMYYCRNRLKLPYQKIGELFQKDHSTVMSSVKQIQKKIDEKKIDLIEFPH